MHSFEPESGRGLGRRLGLIAAALSVVALLALPALASAHPQVYSLTPEKAPSGCTYEAHADGSCLEPTTVRYAIANDGYSLTFTETAGSNPSRGVINYQLIPSGFRKWEVSSVKHQMTGEQLLEFAEDYPAQTPVQAHATCELPVLDEAATILAWQGAEAATAEPFFNYIPWQKKTGGLGDEPEKWIPVVEAKTGVDLSTLPSDDPATTSVNEESEAAKALCEGKGGTYYKADTSSNPATGAIADAVAEAVTPLDAQITTLTGEKSALQLAIDDWKAKNGALETEKAGLVSAEAGLRKRVDGLKKANAGKAKTIRSLRRRLKAARAHG